MADTKKSYDAVIVGGSLAGCAAATLLGRAGARVAVLEKSPDPAAYKRICSHFIQASAVAPPERAARGVNLRRSKLDPMAREMAAATPGVEVMLGQTVTELRRAGGVVS